MEDAQTKFVTTSDVVLPLRTECFRGRAVKTLFFPLHPLFRCTNANRVWRGSSVRISKFFTRGKLKRNAWLEAEFANFLPGLAIDFQFIPRLIEHVCQSSRRRFMYLTWNDNALMPKIWPFLNDPRYHRQWRIPKAPGTARTGLKRDESPTWSLSNSSSDLTSSSSDREKIGCVLIAFVWLRNYNASVKRFLTNVFTVKLSRENPIYIRTSSLKLPGLNPAK